MIDKKLEDAVKSYNQQYSKDENRKYRRYGPEKAALIALKGEDSLDVVVEVSTQRANENYFTPGEFVNNYELPKVYGGFKVSYRIIKVTPAMFF